MRKSRTQPRRIAEPYSERTLKGEGDLLDYLLALDEDEGIRVQGNLKNHTAGGFIFVGCYRGSYCVNICDKVWLPTLHKHVTGGKDEWYYFDTGKQAFNFVMREARRPVRAWLY